MFAETYRPKRISEVMGQPAAVKEFLAWYNTWPEQGKACLLSGKPGTGKTSLVEAVASEMKLDLIELNTSDKRNAETIGRIVGNAASSQTLHGGKKLILLDEIDNMSGREDFGGNRAIAEIISKTQSPIVLIANDAYDVSESIRRACKHIQFHAIHESTIMKRLQEVTDKEKLTAAEEIIKAIAKNASGDIRAALNDLESLQEGLRDSRPTMFSALSELFRKKSVDTRKEFWNLDEQPENVLMWVDENLPYVYEKRDIVQSYNSLSRADIFLGRVSRRQYFGLWGYASDLMTGGVSVAREGRFNFHKFTMPAFILHMSRTKKKRELQKDIAKKIAKKCHCSSYAAKSYIPLLEALSQKPERLASLCLYFEIEEDEISLLTKKPEEVARLMQEEKRKGASKIEKEKDEEEGESPRKKKGRPEELREYDTEGKKGAAPVKNQKTLFDY